MKTKILGALLIFCALLPTFLLSSCSSADGVAEPPISHAVNILAQENYMAISALKGEDIRFSTEDFARALNLESIETITLTSLPPAIDGSIRVGSTLLTTEQTLSASAVGLMVYSPSPSASVTTFKFRVKEKLNKISSKSSCHYSGTET